VLAGRRYHDVVTDYDTPIVHMTKDNWQRLKNLSLFKLWVTDRQLSRLWPIAALIAGILVTITAVRYFFAW
jgi:hypothetical protein